MTTPRRVAIVGGNRIPYCRAHTAYSELGNEQMMTAAMRGLVDRFALTGQRLGDVALGAVMTHPNDWNLARESTLGSGLSPETPAFDIRRACGTSLESVILIANKIALGQIDAGIAGGVDTISGTPILYDEDYRRLLLESSRARKTSERLKSFLKVRPRHFKPVVPGVVEPRTGLSMGQSCEVMAKEWQISRQAQDELALASHERLALAYDAGFYEDLVSPFEGVSEDNTLRRSTTMDKLAALKPVFDRDNGTLTAGNSTPLTDGAGCVLLASEEWARERGLPIQAYLAHVEVAAVDFVGGEGLLMAPAYAVSRMLDKAGLGLQDFDRYEIHEAFAAQVLCTLAAWESEDFCRNRLERDAPLGSVDRDRMNIHGGSIAAGHPFGATGARIVATLAKDLSATDAQRGLVSVCTGGGMGVTAILESA
ncbi:MAG: acetyl-CoA C-acetyltransferase [Gammaproteobacteria bacterium]|nr:acetyl-CoA C-acetyltransferase [Gammaproteobacteria bacterium]NND61259.1 acetyl-CoA C-acetyltransferase [Gammaproteobacteria bacterium]